MMGGTLRSVLPPPKNDRNGAKKLEREFEVFRGNFRDVVAVPIVHPDAEHGQRRLAFDRGIERERTIIIFLDGLLHRVEIVVLIGEGVRQLMGDHRLVFVLVEVVFLAKDPLEQCRRLS